MPLADLPQSILFIIFLLLFVLVGVYPTWKKTAALLRAALQKAAAPDGSEILETTQEQDGDQADRQLAAELNDFEIFILRRLAQERNKALSRRKINADLHLETPMFNSAIESLLQRGLVRATFGLPLGLRYSLSATGQNYTRQQGFSSCMQELTEQAYIHK